MTISSQDALNRRLGKITDARQEKAIALCKPRGIVDGDLSSFIIMFRGARYPTSPEILAQLEAAGVRVEFPLPMKKRTSPAFRRVEGAQNERDEGRDDQGHYNDSKPLENHPFGLSDQEFEKAIRLPRNEREAFFASRRAGHTKAISIEEDNG